MHDQCMNLLPSSSGKQVILSLGLMVRMEDMPWLEARTVYTSRCVKSKVSRLPFTKGPLLLQLLRPPANGTPHRHGVRSSRWSNGTLKRSIHRRSRTHQKCCGKLRLGGRGSEIPGANISLNYSLAARRRTRPPRTLPRPDDVHQLEGRPCTRSAKAHDVRAGRAGSLPGEAPLVSRPVRPFPMPGCPGARSYGVC